ncbi:MAG: hypothetical protein AB1349_00525 [Elusimicrobiota bacterium]
MFRKILSVFICALCGFSLCPLWSHYGKSGWIIFRKLQSPKPKSITAVCAVRGDLSGVLYNPATVASAEQKEVFILGETGLAKDSVAGLIYAQPLKSQTLAAGIMSYNAGKMTLYWIENGLEKEKEVIAQRDLLGFISYARQFTAKLHIGTTLKFANSNIAEVKSASAIGSDFGLLYLAHINGLSLSVAVQNIGLSTKFIEKKEKLPVSISFGSGYTSKLTQKSYLSFGFEVPYIVKDEHLIPGVGLEYGISVFSINSGYRFIKNGDAVFQAGFGIMLADKLEFGYSFLPATYLSDTHRVNVGYRFGEAHGTDAEIERETDAEIERETDAEIERETDAEPKGEIASPTARNDKQLTNRKKKNLMTEHFNKATQLYQKKKYEEAIAEWEAVLKLDPQHKISQHKIETAKKQLNLKK